MSIAQLILAGYFIEAYRRMDGAFIIEAELKNSVCIGQGETFDEAMSNLSNVIKNDNITISNNWRN